MGEPAVENVDGNEIEGVANEAPENETTSTEGETVVEGETETEGEESELEDWMKTDEEENDEKPVKFLKAKKRLKGEIEKKDAEVERLKAEIEALKSKPAKTEQLKRPDPLDFDSDAEYEQALDDYQMERFESRQKKQQAEAAQRQQYEDLQKGVDDHYDRAEQLIQKSGIAPEKFQAADAKLRQSVEKIAPGNGNMIIDNFFAKMKIGSEKVGYYLGNNEAARNKFTQLLIDDPSGLEAAIYLGEEKQRLSKPQKRTTKANPPAPDVTGDSKAQVPANEKALKKAYNEAHKKGDGRAAWQAKSKAKSMGVDVSKW